MGWTKNHPEEYQEQMAKEVGHLFETNGMLYCADQLMDFEVEQLYLLAEAHFGRKAALDCCFNAERMMIERRADSYELLSGV